MATTKVAMAVDLSDTVVDSDTIERVIVILPRNDEISGLNRMRTFNDKGLVNTLCLEINTRVIFIL